MSFNEVQMLYDLIKQDRKTPRECLVSRHPSVPDECHQLRQSFFDCKRSLVRHHVLLFMIGVLI